MSNETQKSWYARILGRSFISVIFGNFFEKKNNSASFIAIMLVGTLCFVILMNMNKIANFEPVINGVLNVIFVVIGYYFGAKQGPTSKDNEDD